MERDYLTENPDVFDHSPTTRRQPTSVPYQRNRRNSVSHHNYSDLERRLEQALRDKDSAEVERSNYEAFISKLAHEMRNPLNGIFGITEMLRDSPETATPDMFRKLHECSCMLSSLIDDTLDLRRMKQKRLRLQERVFHLGELIEAVVDVHIHEAQARQIELQAREAQTLHCVVGDDVRIRQILANLLTNAIKYTTAGGRVDVLGSRESDGSFLLRVRDTGVGISAEDLSTIFEPYFQVTSLAPGSKKGIGLGLSIVKNLVDLMGGSMGVQSAPGQGSTFWVCLPLPEAAEPAPVPRHLAPLHGRILVVDDNVLGRDILKLQLIHLGAVVTLASNGREALLALEKQHFEVVLLDCHMPILNGYETARAARSCPERYGVPVIIALTASASEQARRRCLESGMDEFLRKPVRQSELHQILYRYLHGVNAAGLG